MTYKEIIKALECCISPECENCPYDGDDLLRSCNHNLMKDALDLINRQKAEIKRLRKETSQTIESIRKLARDTIRDTKSETIKEFAMMATNNIEEARKKYQRLCKEQGEKEDEVMNIHYKGIIGIINGIVKEMVGDVE